VGCHWTWRPSFHAAVASLRRQNARGHDGVADVAKWEQRCTNSGPAAALTSPSGVTMSKRGRKKKSRKKNGANHGNRPNA